MRGRSLRLSWPGLALVLLLGCRDAADPARPSGASGASQASQPARPDLSGLPVPRTTRGYILISIDTLRADHLGCYGYGRPTSPFLDSLAQRGTLFEEAYAQFPSTLVSHMSMLTGLHPREHGVLPPSSVLSPKVEILPEVFRRNGFRTGGITEGGYVSGRYGFRRGFDVFISRERTHERQLEKTFRRGVRFLENLAPGKPFFLFLHTYAVHAPYDAPPRYREMFWPGPPPAGAIPPTGPELTRQNLMGEPLPPAVVDWLRALYDAGIRQTDEVIRKFFADLERLGLADDVTVIITADHGEEFLDHGLFNHTQLYRETMHVPLLVVHPDQRSAVRHGGLVQLVDLPPTLYELAGLKPGGRLSGTSLARLLGRSLEPLPGTAWMETQNGERAIYRGATRSQESLLLFDPPTDGWLPRRAAFDARGDLREIQARSFEEPRRLVIRQGTEVLADTVLTPEWTAIPVAPSGPARLVLEADGCTVPADSRKRELQCNAFQVRDLRLARVEYYDVAADPKQLRDLSRERTRETRTLLRDLLAFKPVPVAEAAAAPLDPELEESLRALGYIQ